MDGQAPRRFLQRQRSLFASGSSEPLLDLVLTPAEPLTHSLVSFRDLQLTLEGLGHHRLPAPPVPVPSLQTAPRPGPPELAESPVPLPNLLQMASIASAVPLKACPSQLASLEATPRLADSAEPARTPLTFTQASLDPWQSLTSTASQSPVAPRRGPFTLIVFASDFGYILRYCLYPEKDPMSYYEAHVSPDTHQLLQLIDRHRIRQLRKEQKIKKVVNLAFRILLKKFLSERFGPVSHVSDAMKREFHRHYFGHLDPSGQNGQPRKRPAKTPFFSLTYNRTFFARIRRCELFLADLWDTIGQIREAVVATIRSDLRRFLKHLERFMLYDRPELDKGVALQQFFALRNRDNRKQGIKIPWTEAQYRESIACVIEEVGLSGLPGS